MKNIFQVLFCVGYFLLGLWSSYELGSGANGTQQQLYFNTVLPMLAIWLGIISLSIIAVITVLKRKSNWYVAIALAPCALIAGIISGVILSLIVITPAEYDDHGWAWAVEKYGAWRVLK